MRFENPIDEALEIERLATLCVIAALKAQLKERQFEEALEVALEVASQQSVSRGIDYPKVSKALKRIAGKFKV